MLGSEVFGSEAGYLGEFREHLWADLLVVEEGKSNLGPSGANKCPMASLLTFDGPADAKQGGEHAPCLSGGPFAHAATKDTLRSLADACATCRSSAIA